MKKIILLMAFISSMLSTISCGTYYAAYGNIGIHNLNDPKAVADQKTLKIDRDSISIEYDIKKKEAIVSNKTNKVLVVDKMNSHYIDNKGMSQSLYSNSVTTLSSSVSSGSSLNLGAVAGAFGVRGPVRTLANGINIGSATTDGISTQIIEQQYAIIPPYASQVLSLPEPNQRYTIQGTAPYRKNYSRSYSPMKSQYVISYAFDDNQGKQPSYERDMLYVSEAGVVTGRQDVENSKMWTPTKTHYVDIETPEFEYWMIGGGITMSVAGLLCCIFSDAWVGKAFGGFITACGAGMSIGMSIRLIIKEKRGITYDGLKL